jgi:DNA-binding NarL/FixJ family response regulator
MTRREREIIRLIADGLSNKEIAQRLNVATFTVKSHVHNVLEKLTLRTRAQIASYYVKEGTSPDVAAAD